MKKPHDPADLLLSPIALAIDERLEELGQLDRAELARRITIETNTQPHCHEDAARAVCAAATYLIDTHGWETRWDRRGIRLFHGEHELVLGAPQNVRDYVMTAAGATSAHVCACA